MSRHEPADEGARHRILRAAADLFYRQGVHRTTSQDIISASGTSKGSFYHHFKGKEAVVHEVLKTHIREIEDGTRPVNFDIDSWSELEGWFYRHIELQKMFNMARGCPLGTIGNDVTEADEQTRQDIDRIFALVTKKLQFFFVRERQRGGLSNDADEEAMATLCLATIQGALLLGKVARNCRPAELAVNEALRHLKSYALPPGRADHNI